ncbi:MarR family winged helix-turn-helix transcriptional regulator [Maridesulfovibrio frigidus]|uniref:MarR family winged helix-turn-helix transcriptional regulator n=1 Tax=Maridesulfovibrio frigidus TaxID=340956 RepID=UPI00068F25D9|nr:MarR family transcriptional regulator [Maridesulfovibrio frigidus]
MDKPLLHLFIHIGKLLNDSFREKLNERGIHFGQARILMVLSKHEHLSQVEIGRGLHIKPATVSNLINKMEKSELIKRIPDKNDNRIMLAELTLEGKAASKFAESVFIQVESQVRSSISPEHFDLLRKPLENIRNTFDESYLKNLNI